MALLDNVLQMLDDVLSLNGRSKQFNPETELLGALPELDSMAVATLVTTIEEQFGFAVHDDEISGDTFATVGSLTAFIAERAG